jgi:hypothetical protein
VWGSLRLAPITASITVVTPDTATTPRRWLLVNRTYDRAWYGLRGGQFNGKSIANIVIDECITYDNIFRYLMSSDSATIDRECAWRRLRRAGLDYNSVSHDKILILRHRTRLLESLLVATATEVGDIIVKLIIIHNSGVALLSVATKVATLLAPNDNFILRPSEYDGMIYTIPVSISKIDDARSQIIGLPNLLPTEMIHGNRFIDNNNAYDDQEYMITCSCDDSYDIHRNAIEWNKMEFYHEMVIGGTWLIINPVERYHEMVVGKTINNSQIIIEQQMNYEGFFDIENNYQFQKGGASIPASAVTTIHGQPHYVNINDDCLTSSGLLMEKQELSMGQHKLPPQQHMSSDSSTSANSADCLLPPSDDSSTDSSSCIESTSSPPEYDDINTTTVPIPVSINGIDDTCSQIICPPNSQLPPEMVYSIINFIDNNNNDDLYVTEHKYDSYFNSNEEFVGIHTNDKTPTPSDTNDHRNDVVGVVFEDTPENCKAFGLSYEHEKTHIDCTIEVLADDNDDIIEPVQVQGDDIDGNVIGWRAIECYDEMVFEKTSSMVNANPFKVLHTDNDNGWREEGCHEMVVGMTIGRKSFLETNGSNGVSNDDKSMTDEDAKPHSNILRRFITYIERLKSAVCDSITFSLQIIIIRFYHLATCLVYHVLKL